MIDSAEMSRQQEVFPCLKELMRINRWFLKGKNVGGTYQPSPWLLAQRAAPLAPALPPLGAGAHAIPLNYPKSRFGYYRTIATRAPERTVWSPRSNGFFP